MNATSYLSTIAEVTATFVGLAAILLILLPAMRSDLAGFGRLNMAAFLTMGVVTLIFSLLPGLLAIAPLSEQLRWAIASFAFGGGSLALSAWYSARRRRFAGEASQMRGSFYLFRAVVSAALAVFVLLSPLLVPLPYQPFIYCLAVTWLLAQLGFLVILWWINMGENDAA